MNSRLDAVVSSREGKRSLLWRDVVPNDTSVLPAVTPLPGSLPSPMNTSPYCPTLGALPAVSPQRQTTNSLVHRSSPPAPRNDANSRRAVATNSLLFH
jgi:hypothetical protein